MSTRLAYGEREAHGVRLGELQLSSDGGLNPLSLAVVRALRERLAAVDAAHDPPHLLVLSAEGRGFCAGADVKEFRGFDGPAFEAYMREILALYADMLALCRPIVCRVHADALGGGAALALCSDFAVAADHARFGFPESHRGLAGGGYLIPRLVGKHLAADMVILGRTYSAADMLGHGLLNAVCPADALDARIDALCAELARIPPSALGVAKRSLSAGLSMGLREAMAQHVEAQTAAFVRMRVAGGG